MSDQRTILLKEMSLYDQCDKLFFHSLSFVASHNKLHIYRFRVPLMMGLKILLWICYWIFFFAKKVFSYMSYGIIIKYIPNSEKIYRINMIDLESICATWSTIYVNILNKTAIFISHLFKYLSTYLWMLNFNTESYIYIIPSPKIPITSSIKSVWIYKITVWCIRDHKPSFSATYNIRLNVIKISHYFKIWLVIDIFIFSSPRV